METSKKNQIGCGLGAKFGPNYVQCCEKSKETGNIRFFFIFYLGLPFKARSSGCKTTWVEIYGNYSYKFQIVRMLGPIFARFESKMAKKLIFNNFVLVSQSYKSQN